MRITVDIPDELVLRLQSAGKAADLDLNKELERAAREGAREGVERLAKRLESVPRDERLSPWPEWLREGSLDERLESEEP